VGASSNEMLMSVSSSLLWGLVATARVSRAPTVATGEARSLLLPSSDGITAAGHFTVAIEGYELSVQSHIVIVLVINIIIIHKFYSFFYLFFCTNRCLARK
jgi:Na+/H+-translocating membrane pyrophosphatase